MKLQHLGVVSSGFSACRRTHCAVIQEAGFASFNAFTSRGSLVGASEP
jgi:hypothetical protein